ncbi:hypothetical protein T492DRAFT_516731 [Pavlovales sp. CCMP2436]|nr:hypothetical protein T492DRAFT_516731 [Pavlovales sp. CCMP2436]
MHSYLLLTPYINSTNKQKQVVQAAFRGGKSRASTKAVNDEAVCAATKLQTMTRAWAARKTVVWVRAQRKREVITNNDVLIVNSTVIIITVIIIKVVVIIDLITVIIIIITGAAEERGNN